MDLDRRVAGWFRVEHLLYALLLSAALVLRLLWLGHRPLHHDESIHAYYAWRILTEGIADYRYDPVYHGPTLYYLTAVFQAVLGPSDVSARAFPVACSVGLVALAWPLRTLIGRRAAIAYALLVTFSPTLNYYGRSLRHDVPMAFFTLAATLAFLHYVRRRRVRHLYVAGMLAGLASATKEDVYLTAFTFANTLWILALWTGTESAARERARAWGHDVLRFACQAAIPLLTSVAIALTLFVVFYTSLLTHPENWNAVSRAIRYWWGQHQIQRIGGEWWYYVPLEILYEPLLFVPALATLIVWIRRRPVDRLSGFFATWAILSFAVYAWAQEKVPWLLIPSLIPQAVLAGAYFGSVSVRTRLAWAPVGVLTLWSLVASSYLYDAPRPGEPKDAAHHEPLVYVQTTYDVPEVLREIRSAADSLGTGKQTPMVVVGDATWPLSWYLRGYAVHWGSLPRETTAPILVVDAKDSERLATDLDQNYAKRRFAVRGWWQIDWRRLTPTNLLRFLARRQAWNPPGTTDAVLFVARDLSPQSTRKPIALTPPPPVRTYSGAAEAASPLRTFGRAGIGAGQFREPRGLAIDRDGNLLVADSGNHRVQKLAPDGRPLATWGGPTPGDQPGQFRGVSGLAAAADGSVYVADTWNHRIQKLDGEGRFLLEWREENPGFWGPRAVVTAPDGTVIVADTGNKRLLFYDSAGTRLRSLGGEGSGPGQLIEPVGLAIDPEAGELFVADAGNRRVQIFDLGGAFQREWPAYGWEEFYTEPYLAFGGRSVIVTDSFHQRINFYDPRGRLRSSIGGEGQGLNRPIGVAAAPSGEIFVADTMNHRIVVFRPPTSKRVRRP